MTDGEPKTIVLASLQKIRLIKNLLKEKQKHFCYFIKSETSDSFVNHLILLNGHFAYLKTLDFSFKFKNENDV